MSGFNDDVQNEKDLAEARESAQAALGAGMVKRIKELELSLEWYKYENQRLSERVKEQFKDAVNDAGVIAMLVFCMKDDEKKKYVELGGDPSVFKVKEGVQQL